MIIDLPRVSSEPRRLFSILGDLWNTVGFGRMFLALLVPVYVAFLLLWQASLYIGVALDHDQRAVAFLEGTRHARDTLAETIKTYAADLRITASNGNLHAAILGDSEGMAATARAFRTLVSKKPEIDQIRILDSQGLEVVRVQRRRGVVVTAARSELQNKADRYYFLGAMELPQDGLFISAIDLNVEHGKIEKPWKPMLRIATPIGASEDPDLNDGVLIFNISAKRMLRRIDRSRPTGSEPIQLINRNGYWLAGAPAHLLWGFQLDHRSTIAQSDPKLWEKLQDTRDGSFDHDGDRYVVHSLRPTSYLDAVTDLPWDSSGELVWRMLGRVPGVTLSELWTRDQIPIALAGLGLAAVISLGWCHSLAARRRADAERQQTEREMVRVERLAGLGGLVAGVAHELNTPIGSAVTVASTLSEHAAKFRAEVEAGQVRRSSLDGLLARMQDGTDIMLRSLDRAATLITHFKQVAIDQTSEQPRRFLLKDIVQNVVSAVGPQFKHGPARIEAIISTEAELDSFPGPLGQVLMNLVANAHQHAFDGEETDLVEILARDLSPEEIELVVRDNGRGIPEHLCERVFEPFFTTRLGSGGSGLGLSIVFNIVTGVLGGTIEVHPNSEGGTAFVLRLPISAPESTSHDPGRAYHVEQS